MSIRNLSPRAALTTFIGMVAFVLTMTEYEGTFSTYQTLPTPSPVISPGFLSLNQ